MNIEAMYSSEMCNQLRAIEELSERRVAAIVFIETTGQLSFGLPGGLSDHDVMILLGAVGKASLDALKSL